MIDYHEIADILLKHSLEMSKTHNTNKNLGKSPAYILAEELNKRYHIEKRDDYETVAHQGKPMKKTLAQRLQMLSALWVDSPHEDVKEKVIAALEGLEGAALIFERYATSHQAKADDQQIQTIEYRLNHKRKAEENRKLAEQCRALLD